MIRCFWNRIKFHASDRAPEFALIFFLATFLVVLLRDNIFITVEQGHYGVVWYRFAGGTDLDKTYPEGTRILFPWDKMMIFDGRLQMVEQKLDALSSDGLAMTIDVTYRFELIPEAIPTLARFIGQDYEAKLIAPTVAAHAREIFSRNTPEEIFSLRRDELNKLLMTAVQAEIGKRFKPTWRENLPVQFVDIEDVIIRGISLPASVAAAIEEKNINKQRNEAYNFRLLSEAKEAERKQIEARGIKSFQDIVAPGLTDSYLRWQGIQATQALANSPNSKLVVIGGGRDGMPIILGGWDSANALTTAPPNNGEPSKPQAIAPSNSTNSDAPALAEPMHGKTDAAGSTSGDSKAR